MNWGPWITFISENFLMDYEKTAENVSIKGKEAAVYKSKDDQLHILTWEDDKNQAKCLLGGNIPIDDMVKAAKSVKYDKKKAVRTQKPYNHPNAESGWND